MTYEPGTGDASSDSQARRNGPLPQGLKSSPDIPNPDYPDLGFNPVPGNPDTVRALHKKLGGCAEVLHEAHGVVTRLMDGSYWKGDAAVAFREQIDGGPLPVNLKNASRSIGKAAKQLERWQGELEEFQRRAKTLNGDAKAAREVLRAAQGRADTAADAPELEEKGARQDKAKKALTQANGQVEDAQAELDQVLKKARDLAYEHEEKAGYRAGKIRDATQKLAPHEPGWLDSALDWTMDNLPDILSFVAGAIGVAALILAGPLGWGIAAVAGLMLAASAVSVTALALRVTDPEVRESLWDGVSKGELDADFWSNSVSVGADFAGSLPGIGAVGKGAYTGIRAITGSAEALSLGQRLATYGTKTMDEARAVASLDNPLVGWFVRGAADPEKAAEAVVATSGLVGVGTGGFGLYNKLVDADDDGIKDGTVAGIDGSRLVLDSGGILDLVRHVF